ncbi:MAG TPA: glycerol-3-phosphate 1-O-acyltransferase PlsB [Pseudomonadales bacterium]
MRGLKALGYRLCRWFIGLIARPQLAGSEMDLQAAKAGPVDPASAGNFIYVLGRRSLSDLVILDLVCEQLGVPSPLSAIEYSGHREERRFFFLSRPAGRWVRRDTMRTYSERMVRILRNVDTDCEAALLPVAIFWGRAPQKEGSIWRAMVSENWSVTSRLKRLANLFISRRFIVASYGTPIPLRELAGAEEHLVVRRAARLLRVRLRNQKVATLGPDFSHQRTLANQILASRAVRTAIESSPAGAARAERQARKAVRSIASNMSFPTIRVLARLLTWFWQEIYDGVEIHGLQRLQRAAESHTVVYLPSHRSHIDYLLLSYLLFYRGLMIPHIAAGDNLNLPLVGALLRRGGAFFMRRRFRDDPIYSAVFSEYLYQVYRRGHCVEFFPEGGRSRTGRLLPARLGMLKMTLECHERGIPRPLALVPVYFGYEKLIEASSYLDELRGSEKKRESIADIFRSLTLIRQNFGKVDVNFGEPLVLNDWPEPTVSPSATYDLGQEVLRRINESASINPINLVALVTLSTPRFAIDETQLVEQIECYLALLRLDADHHDFSITALDGAGVVSYVESLGMISREQQEFGDILCHDPVNAVLMTWYRNNVVHTLALPALIACLVRQRRRPLSEPAMTTMVGVVFPYIAAELSIRDAPGALHRWLDHMLTLGLLEKHASGYVAPPAGNPNQHRLQLLSTIIEPTLERLYIVIALLAATGPDGRTRGSLQDDSRKVAQKMSRIYGINSPEFFDARLFNLFIDKLIADGVVEEGTDGVLTHGSLVQDVMKAAGSVLDPQFRYAILLEG